MDRQRKFNLMGAVLVAAIALSSREKAFAAMPDESTLHAVSAAEREIRALIDTQTEALARTFPGRIEVNVGSIDPRLTLAPCTRVEPFMAPGARLWGKSHIGLRCRAGAQWQVFLPVEVRIFAAAVVPIRPLAIGQEVAPEDLQVADVELTREAPGVIVDPRHAEGKIAGRALPAGTPLRAEYLKPRPVMAPGDSVKVVYVGPGFSVASDGKALGAAADGQAVRVQLDTGRVLSGTARPGRRVEVH